MDDHSHCRAILDHLLRDRDFLRHCKKHFVDPVLVDIGDHILLPGYYRYSTDGCSLFVTIHKGDSCQMIGSVIILTNGFYHSICIFTDCNDQQGSFLTFFVSAVLQEFLQCLSATVAEAGIKHIGDQQDHSGIIVSNS